MGLLSLSNEVYQDNQGKCYENIGVPVDYELGYPDDRQSFFEVSSPTWKLISVNF
jgi:hypothetical protein